jgi:hypothetical protein
LLDFVLAGVQFGQLWHVGQVLEASKLVVGEVQFSEAGHVRKALERGESVFSQFEHFDLGMSFKIIERQYLVVIEVNMHQVRQVKRVQGSDFIPLQVNFLQVRKGLSTHQKTHVSQQIIFQVNLHHKLELLQRTHLPHLIKPKVQHSQVRIGINSLVDLFYALIPQAELGEGEVARVHSEREV